MRQALCMVKAGAVGVGCSGFIFAVPPLGESLLDCHIADLEAIPAWRLSLAMRVTRADESTIPILAIRACPLHDLVEVGNVIVQTRTVTLHSTAMAIVYSLLLREARHQLSC